MKKYFITGLVILLPLAVTIAIAVFSVNFLTKPFIGIVSGFLKDFGILNKHLFFLTEQQVILYGSKLLILICLFLFTLLLGVIARWFFFKALLSLSDKILNKIPLINKVYKTTQEIIKTIFVTDKSSFKQVVMVPFPKPGTYVMGLVSRESPKVCSEQSKSTLYSVLVPTTPNPTTGFLLMYKKDEMIFLDLKPEQAIKYIVSCGVITPEYQEKLENESQK